MYIGNCKRLPNSYSLSLTVELLSGAGTNFFKDYKSDKYRRSYVALIALQHRNSNLKSFAHN